MQLERLELLIGDKLEKVTNSSVLVLGLGGVGGFCVESFARCGFGTIILVDNDEIDITNLNRQIISNHSNVGYSKVDEWEKRINSINPNIKVIKIKKFITADNIDKLFSYDFAYAVDACDTISTKFEFNPCTKGSYKFSDLNQLLPDYVSDSIKEALPMFGKKIKGFDRCDLHPRFSEDGKRVYFDTIYTGKRQLCCIDVSSIINDENEN